MHKREEHTRNKVLLQLSCADFRRLRNSLEHVPLKVRTRLVQPHRRIEHVYFVESGLVSIVAGHLSGKCAEIGLIGNDGMSGLSVIMGTDRSPHECFVQVAGSALRISVVDLLDAIGQSSTLLPTLLAFAHELMVQMGETARVNGRFTVEERLARWLLMANDRLDRDEVPLTHELLSTMIGARRVGITIALRMLDAMDAIKTSRGRVIIVDRTKLRSVAGDSYGVTEAEDERLRELRKIVLSQDRCIEGPEDRAMS